MFFRARAWKGIVWHTDTSSVVWTFFDNGKLANQIAKFIAIVLKNHFLNAWASIWCLQTWSFFWLNNIFVVLRKFYCTEVIVLSWIFEQHLKFSVQYFRSLLRNLTGEQYEDVLNVCSMFPDIEMVIKPHGESIS